MRYLVSILALLMMFQPVSRAVGHDAMGHADTAPILVFIAIGDHCQFGDSEQVKSANDIEQPGAHPAAGCLTAGSSALNFFPPATIALEPHYLFVGYSAADFTFYSRTESPEIHPPHNALS